LRALEVRTLQYHWKREKVTIDRLRVADLVDLAEDGSFAALMAPELDALRRVWPDHLVIRANFDERQNSPGVAPATGVNSAPAVGGIVQEAFEGTRDRESYWAERVAARFGGVPDSLSVPL
jgi:hypothetical protein